VSPVRYELDFYIPEDHILHSDRCENLKALQKHIVRTFTESTLSPIQSVLGIPSSGQKQPRRESDNVFALTAELTWW
jgi:hypothetical protein